MIELMITLETLSTLLSSNIAKAKTIIKLSRFEIFCGQLELNSIFIVVAVVVEFSRGEYKKHNIQSRVNNVKRDAFMIILSAILQYELHHYERSRTVESVEKEWKCY